MRSFFVDRVYKPQVVMVCPKGEMFRFAQKPKQIEFSRPHLKTMVRDAQERESPACPQDFEPLFVYRTPAVFIPQGWDYGFVCPNCLSFGEWIETGREEDDVVAAAKPKKEAPAFHDETIPLPKRMEMAKGRRPDAQALCRDGPDGLHRVRLRLRGLRGRARLRQGKGPEPLRPRQGGNGEGRPRPAARARDSPRQFERRSGSVPTRAANVPRSLPSGFLFGGCNRARRGGLRLLVPPGRSTALSPSRPCGVPRPGSAART